MSDTLPVELKIQINKQIILVFRVLQFTEVHDWNSCSETSNLVIFGLWQESKLFH